MATNEPNCGPVANWNTEPNVEPKIASVLPYHRDLYYGGNWQKPSGGYIETTNPANGESLGLCAEADSRDVDAAARAAHQAFREWRRTKPAERAAALKKISLVLLDHAEELALIDAANCGNPVREMMSDVRVAATQIEYFAGLVTEIKGETIPMGEGAVNMTVREPFGVCARIVAYNHPLMFSAGKFASALAAGNTVIMKPPPQAPLSAYRMMELLDGTLPPGVLNVVTGGKACGEALTAHPLIPVVTLIGSVPTGRAIAKSAGGLLKHVGLELGGKNALIVYPDADRERAIEGAVRGMNFTWCGQSCGSTSRLFLHESIHDEVLAGVVEAARRFRPGIPTDMDTNMGAIVSKAQWDKIAGYIELGKREGARLVLGGHAPDDPRLSKGFFIEPTIFADVTMDMRVAKEEIFGPVLCVIRWKQEDEMFEQVNGVEYGLTASIYTSNLASAHRAASRVEAGFVWINHSASHFLGAPFGGFKQSGNLREESIDELLSFTQIKNIHIAL
jgi:betaine-aldehyde dehydrogenase